MITPHYGSYVIEDNELNKMFVVSTLIQQCRNQWKNRICLSFGSCYPSEVSFYCLLPLKLLQNSQFICGCLTSDKGPYVVAPHWKVCFVVFQLCITALLDLMSLRCSTKKQKIAFSLHFPPFLDEHISWLYEYR